MVFLRVTLLEVSDRFPRARIGFGGALGRSPGARFLLIERRVLLLLASNKLSRG